MKLLIALAAASSASALVTRAPPHTAHKDLGSDARAATLRHKSKSKLARSVGSGLNERRLTVSLPPGYSYLSSGSAGDCAGAGKAELTAAQCQDLGAVAGLTWTPGSVGDEGSLEANDDYPPGCYEYVGYAELYFNEPPNGVGSADIFGHPICADITPSGAGGFAEETCDEVDIHRFDDLEACCDDLGTPERSSELQDFLAGLEGTAKTTLTDFCGTQGFSLSGGGGAGAGGFGR